MKIKTQILATIFLSSFCLVGYGFEILQNKVIGIINGFTDLKEDDQLDLAVVLPSITPHAVLQFDIESLLSPNEPMKVGPKEILVPGNLYFPNQTEKYFFMNINISKESFSFYPKKDEKSELSAIWFRAPFSELIRLGRSNAPFSDIIPLLKIKGFAFESARDWNQEQKIILKLDQWLDQRVEFVWNRPQKPSLTTDLALAFQKTSSNRWIMTDLVGNPNADGSLLYSSKIGSELKFIFMRIKNSQDRTPSSAVATIKNNNLDQKKLIIEGLPTPIENGQLIKDQSKTKVTWKPILEPGWIAVLKTSSKTTNNDDDTSPIEPTLSPENEIACILQRLLQKSKTCNQDLHNLEQNTLPSKTLLGWVSPKEGQFELLETLTEKENIMLLYIGTEKAVSKPSETIESQDEPEIFTFAKELKMLELKN